MWNNSTCVVDRCISLTDCCWCELYLIRYKSVQETRLSSRPELVCFLYCQIDIFIPHISYHIYPRSSRFYWKLPLDYSYFFSFKRFGKYQCAENNIVKS